MRRDRRPARVREAGRADLLATLVVGVLLGVVAGAAWGVRAARVPGAVGPAPARPAATAQAREDAVRAGLAWLGKAQEPDGSWDLVRWNPWHGRTGLPGFSEEDHWFQPAATGLALIAFLEALPPAQPLDEPLRRGLERLVAWTRADGRIGHDEAEVDAWFVQEVKVPGLEHPEGPGYKARTLHTFNHACALAALALAAGRPDGAAWRGPLARSLAYTVADEHPEYRWSTFLDPESDIGVVAYVALAARAARDAGLVEEARPLLEALPDFLDRVTNPATGRTAMLSDVPVCFDGDDSTAINAYARRLAGQSSEQAPLSMALASLAGREPRYVPAEIQAGAGHEAFHAHLGAVVNHDAWTYGIRASAGAASARVLSWREAVRALLIRNQVPTGPQAGSWDALGVWDRVGGRLYATSMAVRALAGP